MGSEKLSKAQANSLRALQFYPGGIPVGMRRQTMPTLQSAGYIEVVNHHWRLTKVGRQFLSDNPAGRAALSPAGQGGRDE